MHAFLERFFGGRCTYYVPRWPLTDIEVAVMWRLAGRALSGLQEDWSKVQQVNPDVVGVETNPLLLQRWAASDAAVRVIVRVQVGEHSGRLMLGYPVPVLGQCCTGCRRVRGSPRQRHRPAGTGGICSGPSATWTYR